MWPRLLAAASLALPVLTTAAPEKALTYRILGLDDEARINVRAHLGPEPKTEYERNSFLFSARENIDEGLHALGYYHADVQLDLTRGTQQWKLDIRVTPGEKVVLSAVDVRVNGAAESDEAFTSLLESVPLAAGQTLNHGLYEDFKNELLSLPSFHPSPVFISLSLPFFVPSLPLPSSPSPRLLRVVLAPSRPQRMAEIISRGKEGR